MSDKRGDGVDRRRLLSLGGTAAAASALIPAIGTPVQAAAAAPSSTPVTPGDHFATVVEGTNIAVTASPDGKTLAFDLYGVIWTLPVEGGAAVRLTDDFTDGCQPDWSPDGKTLVFHSYRDGNFHLWTVKADGTGLTQLTNGPYDHREPRWSPDGKSIAFSSDMTGPYNVHVLDVAAGKSRLWVEVKGEACEPCWSPDGKTIAYAVNKTRIDIADAAGKVTAGPALAAPEASMFTPSELHSPAFTPDGKDIAYYALENGKTELRSGKGVLVKGEDVFPFRPVWLSGGDLLYAADGKIKRLGPSGAAVIPFSVSVAVRTPTYAKKQRDYDGTAPRPVVGIGSPALSPDGKQVAFRALNALYVMPLGGKPVALTKDQFWKCDPAWSPDGKQLAYSTDRSGKLDIWVRDMATGAERQVTRHKGAAVSAAWSKDGTQLAFLDQTGSLHTVEIATGAIKQRYPAIWEPGKPSWSADGKTIALAAFKPYSARYREGLSEVLTVDVETGAGTFQPHAPNKSLGTRGDDGPVWSADGGKMVYIFASRIYTVAVDPRGKFTAAPRLLNDELSDAVTFNGDASQVLYLSGGKLRLISSAGGAPRTIPVPLTWATVKSKGKVVVRAGRLWDGTGPELQRDVDIVVEDNRIAAILPLGKGPSDARLIDARDATVIPGLVEMHAHRQMQGYGYGDREGRLWLSLGVTTARSPGSPAYHMVEDRESIEAGLRVGPRYFSTGEAIDGSRIYYNFMRPVTEPGQMKLELERAEALSYDLMKSYVRLPLQDSVALTKWAHERGLHVTSHYHFPTLGYGVDGMEHIGATSRFGYSRNVSATGFSYQDVAAVFIHSGARRTPTLFQASAMYGADRSLVDDPRTRALYPPWEYAKLVARAEQAAKSDNTAILSALARSVDHLRQILRSGGRVVTGTDSPIDMNGISLHMNLRAMVKYGLTPFEALTTATRFSGEYLDQPLGTLVPGKLADLVVTNGNPLANIADAAAVRHVMKNGQVYEIAELVAPFKDQARAAADPVEALPASRKAGFWWHEAAYVESGRAACCQDPFHAIGANGRRVFMAT